MKEEHGLKEDAKNLSLITGSGILAALVTVGLLAAAITRSEPAPEPFRIVIDVPTPEPMVVEVIEPEFVEPIVVEPVGRPLIGSNRIYGEVTTHRGETYVGYIRWDRNEGSWTDLLDATKPRTRSGSTISGIRFGHVDRIDVTGPRSADFTLRNGEHVAFGANATDLGTGLRALIVQQSDGYQAEFHWNDLETVRFMPVPENVRPRESRLFGTLTTRRGMDFTGYVAWDVDEIYSSDVLDGDDEDGRRRKIAFGDIASIERFGSHAAKVVLLNGDEMVLDGTNDVNSSINGISVSDGGLGQVKLDWGEFDRVVFHGTTDETDLTSFDGGRPLEGTVVTDDGSEYSGRVVWDNDESSTWEMLNGEIGDLEFSIEFGNVASIVKSNRGSEVTLLDGRMFELGGSNDVSSGNNGVLIDTGDQVVRVDWDNFRELRLNR